jgi:hypothetical protein
VAEGRNFMKAIDCDLRLLSLEVLACCFRGIVQRKGRKAKRPWERKFDVQ